jgi:histidinol phosphatase-like PHP family hydrolase
MPTKINHDLHIHTYLSACCAAKEEQQAGNIIKRAEEMGLTAIGLSDHIWVNPAIEPTGWYKPQNETHIAKIRQDLAELPPSPVKVSVGCEAETIAPGKFGLTPEFAATLDHVLLSCSHFHMKGFVEQPADDSPASVGRNLLKFFRSGVTSGLPTSIAHPFVPFGFWAQFAGAIASISDDEFIEAFGLAATHKVAIEITMAFLPATPTPEKPNPLWTLDTPVRLLALARQAGCRFTFGTDAHDAAGQKHLPALSELIKLAGITDANILTF